MRGKPKSADVDEAIAQERFLVDGLSIFVFGDLVLDGIGAVEVPRRDPGRKPEWASLVELLDNAPNDPMTLDVRYLNHTLALARDVLVEHFVRGHYPTTGYSDPTDVTFGRVVPSDDAGEPHRTAAEYLRAAFGLVADPTIDPFTDYDHLAARATDECRALNYEQAGLVRKAFRRAGYPTTVPIPWILDALIGVLAEHVRMRRRRRPSSE